MVVVMAQGLRRYTFNFFSQDLPPPPEEPEDTELANEIIREYLRWHDYRGTLSVFESGKRI